MTVDARTHVQEVARNIIRETIIRTLLQIANSQKWTYDEIVDFWQDKGLHHYWFEVLHPEEADLEGMEYGVALDEFEALILGRLEDEIRTRDAVVVEFTVVEDIHFPLGITVRKVMGVRLEGTVIDRIPKDKYTDGSYREPEDGEEVVYVRWTDGTVGWCHSIHVEKVAPDRLG